MFDHASANFSATPLQQHPNFAAALRAVGQAPLLLEDGEPLLILRRRFRGGLRLAMLARATMSDPGACLDRLATAGLGRIPVILSPDAPRPALGKLGALPLMTPATVAELDLTRPKEHRRALLHQKWRNRLKHAERGPLRITRQNLPSDLGHWLFAADRAQQERRGYCGWPAALTLAYGAENPGMAKLFTAYEGKSPVAAMLFLRHGGAATYHIGHTNARGRALSAHSLILWQAAAWLAAKGHKRLDLGFLDTRSAPGLARFKLGSGARARRLGGTWGWWGPTGRLLAPLSLLDRKSM